MDNQATSRHLTNRRHKRINQYTSICLTKPLWYDPWTVHECIWSWLIPFQPSGDFYRTYDYWLYSFYKFHSHFISQFPFFQSSDQKSIQQQWIQLLGHCTNIYRSHMGWPCLAVARLWRCWAGKLTNIRPCIDNLLSWCDPNWHVLFCGTCVLKKRTTYLYCRR